MRFARSTADAGSTCARARLARPGTAALIAALAVELADELFDGTKGATLPLIRHDLALNYVQVGLLTAIPLIAGSLLELPMGVLSGSGRRRRRFILGGGLVFIAAVLAAGLAGSFAVLVIALTVFFPASGAFVSLTQAELMDAAPERQAQHMARWTLAGSAGAVAGPLLAAVVLATGGTWRLAFVIVAVAAAASWVAIAVTGRRRQPSAPNPGSEPVVPGSAPDRDAENGWPGWRSAIALTRRSGALRWLALLEVSDLLLDVLTAFLAVYLVAVGHASPTVAALGVAVRLGAGLVGDVILIRLLERWDGRRVLRVSVPLALGLFPAFLLVPGIGPKLVLLALLTIATAPWYPVLQAELYGSLPGHSGLAVSLTSVASLAGGLGPLIVGVLAQRLGLGWAMASLCIAPVAMLAVPRTRSR
ncbi:MAG TPA: MFS transporter [Streptosporangiaceae bacterium]|jgi:FSR family fosmidomycin resistance protein-like MFS transporter